MQSPTFLRTFFCYHPYAKKSQSHNVTREKLHKAPSYQKLVFKMLMKLTP